MKVRLHTIHCILNDEVDKDEIYLIHKGRRVWPTSRYYQIDTGQHVQVNVDIELSQADKMEIELWDYDLLSPNDLLGKFTAIPKPNEAGRFTTVLAKHDPKSTASYMLEWSVSRS
jgi:hypothetical protein